MPIMVWVGGGIVRLADTEVCPDVMLLSISDLTYLYTIIPRAMDVIVWHEALPMLCRRLMVIEYLDCLQVLKKITKRQPVAVCKYGAELLANMCNKLSIECSSFVMDVVLIFCDFLQYDRHKVSHFSSLTKDMICLELI
ncbi:hypothetical protein DsansV1_C05g0054911 [Dioscorea sansibarensis]